MRLLTAVSLVRAQQGEPKKSRLPFGSLLFLSFCFSWLKPTALVRNALRLLTGDRAAAAGGRRRQRERTAGTRVLRGR